MVSIRRYGLSRVELFIIRSQNIYNLIRIQKMTLSNVHVVICQTHMWSYVKRTCGHMSNVDVVIKTRCISEYNISSSYEVSDGTSTS